MTSEISKGDAALDNKDYVLAIAHFSKALLSTQAPTWLLKRATAYHRLGQFEHALADANSAVLVALGRGKRELIADAYFRRGIVLHGMKQYGNSRMCFHWTRQYNEKLNGLSMWIAKVTADYDAAGGDEAECNAVTIKEVPDKIEPLPSSSTLVLNGEEISSPMTISAGKKVMDSTTTSTSNVRHEWYQSQNAVTVEILAKNIPIGTTDIKIMKTSLEVSFPIGTSQQTYSLHINPLFAEIDSTKSTFRVATHKIEVILQKSKYGLKWSALEATKSQNVSVSSEATMIPPLDVMCDKSSSKPPVYPTSSKSGPKNWDTLVQDENDDDNDGPDAFFKTLYKNADPDTKRAMMKSFQESNGTSLSTQWSDVSSRTFETVPPQGVEAKKWGD
ncbi:hypothetical protein BGHDH14_bgh05227 [Blumeria hordei DH14]|uniref:Uncharacterized protein n=1 Tax=Blumeria graminis f. sp. hordei (strain DH14) TaxID=546991 RepID=N1JJK1_BLUG1|nr:hypothetical protein BGHDH14_bgh05227 [Blumeria hordei DH14]